MHEMKVTPNSQRVYCVCGWTGEQESVTGEWDFLDHLTEVRKTQPPTTAAFNVGSITKVKVGSGGMAPRYHNFKTGELAYVTSGQYQNHIVEVLDTDLHSPRVKFRFLYCEYYCYTCWQSLGEPICRELIGHREYETVMSKCIYLASKETFSAMHTVLDKVRFSRHPRKPGDDA